MQNNHPIQSTCPEIERAQGQIDDSIAILQDLHKNLVNLQAKLDEIRQENIKLRQWGNEKAKRVEELERQRQNHTGTIE